jgi:Carboxypeptidase regulatory-like domain/TonB-dependent Receptor Plug Domain
VVLDQEEQPMSLLPLSSRPCPSALAIGLPAQILTGITIALLVVLSPSSAAQTVTGSISGTVVDSSGAVIPAANITLIKARTGDVRTQMTNAEGRFVFSALLPDSYTVKAEKQGFDTLEQTDVILSANENLAGKLGLSPGRTTEVVIVTEGGGKVEIETSDLTARLTADQIDLISTKGRDITSLLRLIPGTSYIDDVESVGEGFGTDLPNINGQRGRSTVSNVDGLNASEPSGSNKISMTTNQDAIAEVKVLRNNMDAEYGNNGGAIINIVTKSGGTSCHGGGYYYLRNEALNANSYLNNNRGLPRALYRHNIWGANLGGPLQIPKIFPNPQREKLFFFYSFDRPHTITATSTVFATVPTALECQGDFSHSLDTSKRPLLVADPQLIAAGKTCSYDKNNVATTTGCFPGMKIPQSRWNSNTAGFLNVFPLPNTLLAGGQNYQVQKSVNVPKWSQLLHIDFHPREKDSFFWKGQQWSSDNEGFDTSGWRHNDDARWGIDSHYLYKELGMTVGWTHTFTPNLVNESNVSVRHDSEGPAA